MPPHCRRSLGRRIFTPSPSNSVLFWLTFCTTSCSSALLFWVSFRVWQSLVILPFCSPPPDIFSALTRGGIGMSEMENVREVTVHLLEHPGGLSGGDITIIILKRYCTMTVFYILLYSDLASLTVTAEYLPFQWFQYFVNLSVTPRCAFCRRCDDTFQAETTGTGRPAFTSRIRNETHDGYARLPAVFQFVYLLSIIEMQKYCGLT